MTSTSNLPDWPGADSIYKRASSLLDRMAKSGHVEIIRKGKRIIGSRPSEEMREIIDAMNKGDEENLKGLLLLPWNRA